MAQRKGRPKDRESWDKIYVEGKLPWDSGKPDVHLLEVIDEIGHNFGKALEIGCGTGTNLIWLAEKGFEVTGMDISPTAVAKARKKVSAADINIHLFSGDFMVDQVPGAPFDFVYDRGCLHVFEGVKELSRFASRVGELLVPEGIWHSLAGSTDGPPRDTGPPRHSATDIVTAVEPHFEILELRATRFDRENHNHAKAWVLVARRRTIYSD
jgi:SAM-dependent methyltransferase